MNRVHYRKVKPSRLYNNESNISNDNEPTTAETFILQSTVCGVLIICVLLISLTNLAPATRIRESLNLILTGAETPYELITSARTISEDFFGWGPTEEIIPEAIPMQTPIPIPLPELEIEPEPAEFIPLPPPMPEATIEPTTHQESPTWITPVSGRISSPAGNRYNPVTGRREFHDGIDIAVPTGTTIVAPKAGEVIASGFCPGFGYFMRLAHDNEYISFYGHLSQPIASLGDFVTQGTLLAYSGNTGQSTGPHLHFGIFQNGQFIDPLTRVNP